MPREYLGCAWLVDYEVHGRGTELVRSVTSTYAEGGTDDGSAGVTSSTGLLSDTERRGRISQCQSVLARITRREHA